MPKKAVAADIPQEVLTLISRINWPKITPARVSDLVKKLELAISMLGLPKR